MRALIGKAEDMKTKIHEWGGNGKSKWLEEMYTMESERQIMREALSKRLNTRRLVWGKTILVVDDSASMRQLVTFALKSAGYDVIAAVHGKDDSKN